MAKTIGKEVGRHLWYGKHTDSQHDAHHAQGRHNGHGNEGHEQIFNRMHRQPLRLSKGSIKSNADNGAIQQNEDQRNQGRYGAEQPKVRRADSEVAAKEERGLVGHKAWRKEAEQDAHTHAEGPKEGDGRVFTHLHLSRKPLYPEGAEHSIHHSRHDRVDAKEHANANATKRGMRNATADEHQSSADNVGAHNAAHHAGQQRPQERVLKECILKDTHVFVRLFNHHYHLVFQGVGQVDASQGEASAPGRHLVLPHGVKHIRKL